MSRRSKVTQMPKAVRDWFDQLLIENNFSRYEQLTAEVNQKLAELGYELRFGKSAAHRYGKELELRIQSIKDTTQAMTAVADAYPDDAAGRSTATIAMIETGLFDVIYLLKQADAETDPSERIKLLSRAGKTVAEITRASVTLKKFQTGVRDKAAAAADRAVKIAKKGGLTASAVDTIRREILGIAN